MAVPLLAAAVPAVGALLGGIFQGSSNERANTANIKFAQQMYEQQRADNLSMWNTQNEYNSPQAQMERLRKSGLNPNMVYGNGSAVNTASPVANATPSVPHITASNALSGIAAASDSIGRYVDLEAKQASIDNMRAQNTLLKQEALAKAVGLESATFDLDLKQGLKENTLEMKKWALQDLVNSANLKSTNQFGKSIENNILDKTQDSRIKAAQLQPSVIKAQLDNILTGTKLRQAELELKTLETQLQKNGITKSDPFYIRIMARFASKYGLTIQP